MATTFLQVMPIQGAARYQAIDTDIMMLAVDAREWAKVDSAKTPERAREKANRLQVKENMAVSKAQKKAAK